MKNYWLPIIIVVGLALRILGIFWGEIDKPKHDIWEPDEFQHSEIAAHQIHLLDTTQYAKRNFSIIWNTRAYGNQLGAIMYVGNQLGLVEFKNHKIIQVGRFLSTFYAALLILLVFYFARVLFNDDRIALLSAFLIAIFDLNITYSHYALPASSYIFWVHLALLATVLLMKRSMLKKPFNLKTYLGLLLLPLPFAMSLATKLDFIPLIVFFSTVLFLLVSKKMKIIHAVYLGLWLLLGGAFYFIAAHGFRVNLDKAWQSFNTIKDLNDNIIPQDNHWLHNPILYFMGVVGGTSLAIVAIAISSTFKVLKRPIKLLDNHATLGIVIFLLFLFLEFLVRWRLDTPFIRRANVFLPYVALLSAYGLIIFLDSHFYNIRLRKIVIGAILAYTLGLTIVSQSNFWNDTRYQCRTYLLENIQDGEKIKYSMYAKAKNMPKESAKSFEEADILVLHETYYARYWKMFTTPFKVPDCCEEVYHCRDKGVCEKMQNILKGTTEFELVKYIPTIEIFPERVLFKHWFGSYETFLGDIRVYRKK